LFVIKKQLLVKILFKGLGVTAAAHFGYFFWGVTVEEPSPKRKHFLNKNDDLCKLLLMFVYKHINNQIYYAHVFHLLFLSASPVTTTVQL